MLNSLRQEVTHKLGLIRPITQEEQQAMMAQLVAQQQAAQPQPVAPQPVPALQAAPAATAPRPGFDAQDRTTWGDPSRNDSCPCGSGEKFKHCHGKLD